MSDLVYRVHLKDSWSTYVAEILRTPQVRAQLESAVRTDVGQTLKVRGDDLRELLVPPLPSTVQTAAAREIDSYLGPLRRLSRDLTSSIELLRERRQALITAAVIGQLQVPVAA